MPMNSNSLIERAVMRKTRMQIKFLCVLLASLSFASAASFTATAVTVTAAIPESGDSAKTAWEKAKAGRDVATAAAEAATDPVYLVKVYVKLPPAGSESYQLWVGDEEVPEFGSFKHGIFFKVYGQEQLSKWAGKPLRMGLRGQAPQPLGQDFPPEAAKDAIRAAGSAPARPKTKDVLAD
jgi:hypothetical protein